MLAIHSALDLGMLLAVEVGQWQSSKGNFGFNLQTDFLCKCPSVRKAGAPDQVSLLGQWKMKVEVHCAPHWIASFAFFPRSVMTPEIHLPCKSLLWVELARKDYLGAECQKGIIGQQITQIHNLPHISHSFKIKIKGGVHGPGHFAGRRLLLDLPLLKQLQLGKDWAFQRLQLGKGQAVLLSSSFFSTLLKCGEKGIG